MRLEQSGLILEEYSNIKHFENLFSGSRIVPWGQTDRYDEVNGRFFASLRTRLKATMECIHRSVIQLNFSIFYYEHFTGESTRDSKSCTF